MVGKSQKKNNISWKVKVICNAHFSVYKCYWNTTNTCVNIFYGCVWAPRADLSSQGRDSQRLKYLLCGTLPKKFANPFLTQRCYHWHNLKFDKTERTGQRNSQKQAGHFNSVWLEGQMLQRTRWRWEEEDSEE